MDVDCEESERILMVVHMRTGVAVAAVLRSIDPLETVTNFFPTWTGNPLCCGMEREAGQAAADMAARLDHRADLCR